MTNKNSAFEWKTASFEVMAIVFAVLLALWLEGWREDIERQERADVFLDHIRVEIEQNRSELESAMASNQSSIDGISSFLASDSFDFADIAQFVQINGASTRNAAWQSAQMTQSITSMPNETVTMLAGIYDTQGYYADYMRVFFQRFTDLAMDMRLEETRDTALRTFRQHLAVSNSLAQQLIEEYDAYLARSALSE